MLEVLGKARFLSTYQLGNVLNHPSSVGIALVVYLSFYGALGHTGDLLFWQNWYTQITTGYEALDANYPPLLLHWMWLVSNIYQLLNLSFALDNPIALKFWVTLPSLIAHLLVVFLAEKVLRSRGKEPIKEPVFWLMLLNPAVLINGPVWGQVDYMVVVPAILAIWSACRHNFFLAGVCFAIALLSKFQAIVILPVLAGLFLNGFSIKRMKEVPHIVFGIGCTFALFYLPYFIAGNAAESFKAAYTGNTDLYPYATFFGANLWYAFLGNATDMHQPLIAALTWLTPKTVGYVAFFSLSAIVMTRVALCDRSVGKALAYAAIMYLVFFGIAPSMHERYMFAFVPLAFLAWSCGKMHSAWFVAGTIIVTINQLLVLPLSGEDMWFATSVFTTVFLLAATITVLFDTKFQLRWFETAGVGQAVTVLLITTIAAISTGRSKNIEFASNGIAELTKFAPTQSTQGWGQLATEHNSDPSIMVNGQPFSGRLKTHAPSSISFEVPVGATSFSTFAALQQQGEMGRVRFQILVDGQEQWVSQSITHGLNTSIILPVTGASLIELKVLPDGSMDYDHAQWLDPRFSNQ